ncbi:MAG TPA: dehydrogenase [Phenylobacterium sp.]|uniref:GHMP family kinase ATP-binding protein n=1 Tax=Phenylobacterium sp. TaxID=1871053 RepID=UPI002F93CDFA
MRHELVRARAPLRLGFGGGGTDVSPYCDEHGGVVLNATIDLFAHVTIEARTDDQVLLVAADRDQAWRAPATAPLPTDEPLRLLKGVYNRFMAQNGRAIPLTMVSYADCPPGSGLGSSSALVVAMVEGMRRFMGLEMSPQAVAALAYDIERCDLGLAGGTQDQYAAAFGGMNFMRFFEKARVEVEGLTVPEKVLKELEASLVLYFTGVSRESAAIIDEQKANMKSQAPKSLESLHALKAGAFEMRDALVAGDLPRFGALLDAGWLSKKQTAHNISSPEIDKVYEAAKAFGVFGGKVSGAGGGGFMMFLVDPPRREGLKRLLGGFGGVAQGAAFTRTGAESWDVR